LEDECPWWRKREYSVRRPTPIVIFALNSSVKRAVLFFDWAPIVHFEIILQWLPPFTPHLNFYIETSTVVSYSFDLSFYGGKDLSMTRLLQGTMLKNSIQLLKLNLPLGSFSLFVQLYLSFLALWLLYFAGVSRKGPSINVWQKILVSAFLRSSNEESNGVQSNQYQSFPSDQIRM